MRNLRSLIAALLSFSSATVPASAQTLTAIGNSVEMYLDNICLTGTCASAFPQNTTGRIIKITYVSCEMTLNGASNRILFASIGPSVSPTNVVLIKRTYFDTLRSATQTEGLVYYLSATPGLLLGAGRYLAVSVIPSGGQIAMRCAAAGTFAN